MLKAVVYAVGAVMVSGFAVLITPNTCNADGEQCAQNCYTINQSLGYKGYLFGIPVCYACWVPEGRTEIF